MEAGSFATACRCMPCLLYTSQALFNLEGVDLEFRDEALTAIAKKAMARKTGARGLRSIVEAALLETMYDLPSMENVEKVVVDENVIEGQAEPMPVSYTHLDVYKRQG